MGRALGVLGLLLGLALGQGLEVGLRGGGGVGVAYLRLEGVWTLEGVRLGLALAPYLLLPGGKGEFLLERAFLEAQEGDWALTLGRLPLTPGEGRLFPYTWNAPNPLGGSTGVLGGLLTHYGPEHRLRLGLTEKGPFAELALKEGRLFLFREGAGLLGSWPLGEGVGYGEAFWTQDGPRGLLGYTAFWGPWLLTLEGVYPLGAALALAWEGEGLALQGLLGVRQGLFGGLTLRWEAWSLGLSGVGGRFLGWVSYRGDF
ncbi:hypothetical protein ACLWNE_05900 [Thermus oshimai]|uniref:hypothetical protein n=1 Tax=Thermus oshimai TaxID=56957 RepID=UPI000360422E|nr:hypothetical protein [Thermus oshimai]